MYLKIEIETAATQNIKTNPLILGVCLNNEILSGES